MSLLLVVAAVVLVSFVAVVVVLETARRSPLTPTDLYCAALDQRLAQDGDEIRVTGRPSRTARGPAARGARRPGVAV